MENIKKYIIPIILGILILIILGEGYLLTRQSNSNLKADKALVKKDRVEVKQLAKVDTILAHQARVLRDSLNYHKKRGDYWKAKYMAPLHITKSDVKKVFKEDSTTIATKVIKGGECDSLQREQSITIKFFDKENSKLDSLNKVRAKSITYLMNLDSLNINIQKSLEKKVRNRTFGEAILGALSLLLILVAIIPH